MTLEIVSLLFIPSPHLRGKEAGLGCRDVTVQKHLQNMPQTPTNVEGQCHVMTKKLSCKPRGTQFESCLCYELTPVVSQQPTSPFCNKGIIYTDLWCRTLTKRGLKSANRSEFSLKALRPCLALSWLARDVVLLTQPFPAPLLSKAEKIKDMPWEEQKAKAAAVSTSRLLTQEEFQKIRLAQLSKELKAAPGKAAKRKTLEIESDEQRR